MKRWVVAMLLLCLLAFQVTPVTVDAKRKAPTVKSLTNVVKKYAKSSYPFSSSDKQKADGSIFGIMASKLSGYSAFQKNEGTGIADSTEYMLFIGKSKSKSAAKSCASSLRRFLTKEKSGKASSLSAEGRKLFAGVQIGSKGKWCWLIMVSSDSSVNEEASKAVKKAAK